MVLIVSFILAEIFNYFLLAVHIFFYSKLTKILNKEIDLYRVINELTYHYLEFTRKYVLIKRKIICDYDNGYLNLLTIS